MRSRYIPLLSVSMLLQSGAALQPLSPYSSSAHQEVNDPTVQSVLSSRRGFLSTATLATLGVMTPAILAPTKPALAVAPITTQEAEAGKLGGGLSRKIQPPNPSKVPRQPLALDFVILLTRAAYAETVQLEIVPGNQLERDMYAVRQAEYQPYVTRVNQAGGVVKQGDLTDPYYFDYTSLSQFLTINRAMQSPERDYEQLEAIQNDDGTQSSDYKPISIHRTLADKDLIPAYDQRVGMGILNYFQDRYKGTAIALPQFDEPATELLPAMQQLAKLFLINGFCWEAKAELVSDKPEKGSATFRFTLDNPATLWSSQCLEKSAVRNDFLRKTAQPYLESMGYQVSSYSVKLQNNKEVTTIAIQ